MFNQIPLSRALIYLLVLGLVPIFLSTAYFFSNKTRIEELQTSLQLAKHQLFIKEKKEAYNSTIQQQYRDADHFYIDKYLETLVFLEPEIESLQQLLKDKNFIEDERIKKRIEFLTGTKNSLVFSEGVVQSTPQLQETTETLVNPVEVNLSDILKILSRVEGIDIPPFTPGPNRPQLIITEFKIEKKKTSERNEVFLLNLKLIKREFL